MPIISEAGGGGGSAFNGGTITNPLVIAPASPSSAPLTVQGPTGLIAAGFDLVEVLDETSSDRFQVFPDGAARVDQAAGETSRIVAQAGAQLTVADTGISVSAGATGPIRLFDASGNTVMRVDDVNKLGFYGAAAVAKQTGVAVTAAAIHAALVNLGLISA